MNDERNRRLEELEARAQAAQNEMDREGEILKIEASFLGIVDAIIEKMAHAAEMNYASEADLEAVHICIMFHLAIPKFKTLNGFEKIQAIEYAPGKIINAFGFHGTPAEYDRLYSRENLTPHSRIEHIRERLELQQNEQRFQLLVSESTFLHILDQAIEMLNQAEQLQEESPVEGLNHVEMYIGVIFRLAKPILQKFPEFENIRAFEYEEDKIIQASGFSGTRLEYDQLYPSDELITYNRILLARERVAALRNKETTRKETQQENLR